MEASIPKPQTQAKYKDYRFTSLFVSVILICLVPFTTPYLAYVPFVIQLIRIVACKAEVFLIDLACLLPYYNIFREPGGKTFYAMLIIAACAFFMITKKFKPSASFVFCAILFCYMLTRSLNNFISALPALTGVLIIYLVSNFLNRENAILTAKVNVISTLFASVYGFVFRDTSAIMNYTKDPSLAQFGNDAVRFKGLFLDPNYYATCIIMAIVLLIILYIIKEIKVIPFIIGFLGLTVFGFITYSKSFLIVYAVACFFFMAASVKRKRFLLFFVFGLFFLIMLFNFASENIEFFAVMRDRFGESDDLNSLTTGRYDSWVNYLTYVFSDAKTMFFGDTLDAPMINSLGTHNLIIELLYYTGIVGLVLFIAFFWSVLRDVLRKNAPNKKSREGLMKYGTIAVFIIFYMSLQAVYFSTMYVQWLLVIIGTLLSIKTIDSAGNSFETNNQES